MKDSALYERELQRSLMLLRESLEEGKLSLPADEKLKQSLLKIKIRGDGSIDLDTVDACVRSLARTCTMLHDREALKDVASLPDIQCTYFEFVHKSFGDLYQDMKNKGYTADFVGSLFSENDELRSSILPQVDAFLEKIKVFWSHIDDVAWTHVEDLQCLKGVYGGSLFPSYSNNVASKCGIYTDTIVLPDPFLRAEPLFERSSDQYKIYYTIRHVMTLLDYKELATVDLGLPIVVVLPDPTLQKFERDLIVGFGESDWLIHAQHIFGREFESVDHLFSFCSSLDSYSKVADEIKDESRFVFNDDIKGSFEDKLRYQYAGDDYKVLQTENPGAILALSTTGRMSQANEVLVRSARFNGIPIVDAPVSWEYFKWKLEYDGFRTNPGEMFDLHVTKGLQNIADGKMTWIGNIPTDALIEIRKVGALDEIREVLGKGVHEISKISPSDFAKSADQIMENIQSSFSVHQGKVRELKNKKWKFAGCDVGSWLVSGTLEVAAALTGTPLYGLSAFVINQLVDAPKIKDIPTAYRKIVEEANQVERSPVGLLFKCSQANK
ncbi:hypothetical protein [Maridesulfovibrio salexigens]|uniref:Uncharacterized protein n=1 Tax=Maridesulfovibrio salexigens (strain ATCC 14822 / DSM 2638 / NCIMB 8403 / VKM B-1763) TaxID=526222 RepID=C6BVW3_MARSD|nr:hypothetical protein [Maridesulfovibrio salexigens]ACS80166.1 conserved hypothetical protein [Maridesulfovibrio salexigens DSM 2638]